MGLLYLFLSLKERANLLDYTGLNLKFCLHSIQSFNSSFTVKPLLLGTKDQPFNSVYQHCMNNINTLFGQQAALLNVHASCTIERPLYCKGVSSTAVLKTFMNFMTS